MLCDLFVFFFIPLGLPLYGKSLLMVFRKSLVLFLVATFASFSLSAPLLIMSLFLILLLLDILSSSVELFTLFPLMLFSIFLSLSFFDRFSIFIVSNLFFNSCLLSSTITCCIFNLFICSSSITFDGCLFVFSQT